MACQCVTDCYLGIGADECCAFGCEGCRQQAPAASICEGNVVATTGHDTPAGWMVLGQVGTRILCFGGFCGPKGGRRVPAPISTFLGSMWCFLK